MILVIGGAYQGKEDYVRKHFGEGYVIINHYHQEIRNQLRQGLEPLKEVEGLAVEDEKLIIICDEVGYGLVPMEPEERLYREQVGRVAGYLANRANQVIRVVCGIGVRIK